MDTCHSRVIKERPVNAIFPVPIMQTYLASQSYEEQSSVTTGDSSITLQDLDAVFSASITMPHQA
jgi:hypothetical protein